MTFERDPGQSRRMASVDQTERAKATVRRFGRSDRSSSWGMNRQSNLDDQFVSFAAKADCDEGLGYL